jgi:aspartyl-tRNA(Asn)/glutamyl-tRNA(Gln) amidotransferase subunit A
VAAPPLGTLRECREALDAGRTRSEALVEQSLARAQACAPLRAFVRLRADAARAEAKAADLRRARGERRSPLDGIPFAAKDNLVRAGEETGCASRILQGFVSPYTSTVRERL